MANKYYNSAAAGSNNGTSEANAWQTLAVCAPSSGDTLWVKNSSAEATATTPTFAGSLALPVQVLCSSWSAEPPTTLSTGAVIGFTGSLSLASTCMYWYGVGLTLTGSSSSILSICDAGNALQIFENTPFTITSTGGSAQLRVGGNTSNNASLCVWKSCQVKFGATSQGIQLGCKFRAYAMSFISGGSAITTLINTYATNRAADAVFYAPDFTNAPTAMSLVAGGTIGSVGLIQFLNATMPASWSGGVASQQINSPGFRAELIGYKVSGGSDVSYQFWVEDCGGNIKHDTSVTRTGGFTEGSGGQALSHKHTTSNNNAYPAACLVGRTMYAEIASTGSSVTVTVYGIWDSATNIKNNQCAMRVFELDSGRTIATTLPADVLTTATDLTADTSTWANSMTNPNKFKMALSFTPSVLGVVGVEVLLFTGNGTVVYIDPKPVVA